MTNDPGQGDKVYVKNPEEVFYHDVPADLQKDAVAKLTHQSLAVFNDIVTHQPWEELDCMYMYCDEDKALLPHIQKMLAPQLGEDALSWTCKGASHSPFLSMPDDVTEGLVYGAQEISKKL